MALERCSLSAHRPTMAGAVRHQPGADRSHPGPRLWRGCSDLAATLADVLPGHRRKLRLQQRPVLGRQPLSAEARPDVKGHMQPDVPSQLLNFATRSLAAGQLAAAEIACRDLLDLAPGDAALLH